MNWLSTELCSYMLKDIDGLSRKSKGQRVTITDAYIETALLTTLRDLRYAALRAEGIAIDGSKPKRAVAEAAA